MSDFEDDFVPEDDSFTGLPPFCFLDNRFHLRFHLTLPLQHGVKVIGLIGPHLGHGEAVSDDLPDHHLQRLAVLLGQSEQQAGEHGEDHHQGGGAGGDAAPEHKKERQAHQERRAEAYDLPFCQAEQHFAFYMGQVLGDGHIGHRVNSSFPERDRCPAWCRPRRGRR